MPPRFTATTEAASSRQVAFSVEEHEDGRAEVMARVEARVHMQLAALREQNAAARVEAKRAEARELRLSIELRELREHVAEQQRQLASQQQALRLEQEAHRETRARAQELDAECDALEDALQRAATEGVLQRRHAAQLVAALGPRDDDPARLVRDASADASLSPGRGCDPPRDSASSPSWESLVDEFNSPSFSLWARV
jgi:chromosome segregation ATPase